MKLLAKFVTRHAWLVLGGVVVIVVAALLNGVRPEPEDDILVFLPPGDPDITMFQRISDQFGGLEVAMVGIETRDVFEPAFLKELDKLTSDLRDTNGVDRVVSLTNLADFETDEKHRGIKAGALVDVRQFRKPEYLSALRSRVLHKEHVVGQFVNEAGTSTLVLCFLVPGANQTQVVERIQQVAKRHLGDKKLYWGGAPFASAHIFETTESDIRLLTPFALLVIVVIMLVSFRDPLGVVLSLLSTGVGAVVAFSLMVAFDVKLNLVLSSMPVILFAVGSAYGIHILSRYYKLVQTEERQEAIRRAVREVGPAVLATGITTMAGFLSFVVMDIPPMRLFGLFTAVGIGASMLTALLVIPAVLSLTGRFKRFGQGKKGEGWLQRQVGSVAAASLRRRWVTLAIASVLAVVGIGFATQIKVEVEPSAFYAEGSPPDRADEFMGRNFGGSQFVQVHFDLEPRSQTDRETAEALGSFFPHVRDRTKPVIEDPLVMREIRRFAEIMAQHPDVSSVLHVGLPISLGNEMADDQRRIPDSRAKIKNIYGLVSTDPTMNQLLSPSHRDLLVHVKIRSSRIEVVNRVLRRASKVIRDEFRTNLRRVDLRTETDPALRKRAIETLIQDTADHVLAMARVYDAAPAAGARQRVVQVLRTRKGQEVKATTEAKAQVARNMRGYLLSGEFPGMWPARTPEGETYDKQRIATAVASRLAQLGPGASDEARDAAVKAVAAGAIGETKSLDFSTFLARELKHSWQLQRSDQLGMAVARALGVKKPGPRLRKALATATIDLAAPVVGVPVTEKELARLAFEREAAPAATKRSAPGARAAARARPARPARPARKAAPKKQKGESAEDVWAAGGGAGEAGEWDTGGGAGEGGEGDAGGGAGEGGEWDVAPDQPDRAARPVAAASPSAGSRPEVIRIRPTVSGMPVVLRGLARSVERNQVYSLLVSLGIVFLVMVIMFRSLYAGFLALLPAGLTLVAVFGGLSLVGKPLDISTSMVAGIAIGVGIDYAIHFLSWWQRPRDHQWTTTAREAARESGGGILANALMVCAGFAVLALGESAPTKALGVLIAVAMLMAAVVTFVVIPAGAGRRVYYQRIEESAEPEEREQAAELAPTPTKEAS